ncbi:MAG: hypothetical protein Q7V05_13140 [Methanoregula sp.]|nr:hypothetical protein [Methanoregula sp.]
MFGKLSPILDAVPYYLVDYQERRAENDDGTRWVDRVTTDGTWSGNLYDFFQIAIQKLYREYHSNWPGLPASRIPRFMKPCVKH